MLRRQCLVCATLGYWACIDAIKSRLRDIPSYMKREALLPLVAAACWALGCGFQVSGDAPAIGGAGGSSAGPHTPGAAGSGIGSGSGDVGNNAGQGGSAAALSVAGGGMTNAGGMTGSSGAPAGGSAGTASAAAGSAGAASGGAGPVFSHFKFLWRDEFDSFDGNRWKKASHEFAENAAQFSPNNAVVEGGFLNLRITNTPNNGHPYSAAEVYTNDQFTFGRFEARIKFAAGSGIVSSLFTYRDNADSGWNEIDLENLGYVTNGVQYNLISSPQGTGNLKYQPHVVPTGYKPTEEFHDYAIEWTPDEIRFFIDSKQVWKDAQPLIKNASRLRMNCWPTNNATTTFAGPLDASKIPAEAQYEWVAVYAYQP